jgi:glycosidase
MRKTLLLCLAFITVTSINAQLLTWTPNFAKDNDNIAITVDATKGNQGLLNFAGPVYVHTGVITSTSTSQTDWKYSKFAWGTANVAAQATSAGTNKWTYTITGGIRAFYGVPTGETILRIAILFRDAAGNLVQRNEDATDMYVPVYDNNLAVRFTAPPLQPKYTLIPETINITAGNTLPVTGIASTASNMKLYFNGTAIQTATNVTTINALPTVTSGNQQLVVEAITTSPAATKRDTINFFVAGGVNIAPLPAGVREGINYINATTATLVLFAPGKNRVSVISEFPSGSWNETAANQMNKTPDGNYWWITVNGLISGQIYAYQYLVDGVLKVADPYTEMVLDQNDQFISATTFPGLKPYPTGLTTGIVSTLQTNAPTFSWTSTAYTRPDKRNLVVYELLLRDFVLAHDFTTLKDSLNYFKRLGINAIELMPINEFEGNESWGYNPDFYFAQDKYYGTKTKLKEFIDAAHNNGIAVIMDIAMNHATGEAPQAKLYWNSATNQPAANNPWMNQTATHPFSVFNDFNHENTATKYLVNRVVEHWLTEYKIDGFRWDLSKGFTQFNSGNNVTLMGNYDLSRINIWKRIYDEMQSKAAGSYCILEHFADNQEEKELVAHGMLLWGNLVGAYTQTAKGFVANSDMGGITHTSRGWPTPSLVGYGVSHDEERTMYNTVLSGNSNATYNTRLIPTALQREEMLAALHLTVPGPKMIWQFAELGYDYSINTCTNGTVNNACRLDKKPIRWDYLNDANRKKLWDTYAMLNNLRKLKPLAFTDGTIEYSTNGAVKWFKITHSSLKMLVVANIDIIEQTATVSFPTAAFYYSYLKNTGLTASGLTQNLVLAPGEFHVYLDQNLTGAVITAIGNVPNNALNMVTTVLPNPINSNAVLQYDLPENGKLNIAVLNMHGQTLGTLENGFKTKGKYTQNLNTNSFLCSNLASGVYLLKITLNNKTKTIKIII